MNTDINLRKIRLSRGFNPKAAATKIGISAQYLSRLENGHQRPSRDTLEKIIEAYQVPLEDAEHLRDQYGYGTAGPSAASVRADVVAGSSGALLPKFNLSAENVPVIYTDAIAISSDDFGIVLYAGQKNALKNEFQIVSRIGFSLQHAVKIQAALEHHIKKLQNKDIKD